MTEGKPERHKRSKSSLAVSLLHRDRSKDDVRRSDSSLRPSNDAGSSKDSLSTNPPFFAEAASIGSSMLGPRTSRFNEAPSSPTSSIRPFSQAGQPPTDGLSSISTSNLPSTTASLEQSVRTFHLFGILRNKDLATISEALREASNEERDNEGGRQSFSITPKSDLLNGTTILHLAVQCADHSVIEFILSQAAADPDLVVDINARDKDGNTALHLAALLGRSQVIGTLLSQDDINHSVSNHQGRYPIDLARNADVVQQLQVARALSIDSKLRDLHKLVARGDYDSIQGFLSDSYNKALLDLDAAELVTDPAVISSGGTLLHQAARKKDSRLIEILLLNGADPFRSDRRGKLPQDVTKDERTRATLKKSPAAAAAQRGIQEKTILRSGGLRPTTAAAGGSSAEGSTISKEAREMKGYLKKWTNYTGGYKLRWFVLEDGVLSYYKHQDDAGSACRGAINMKIARISMDPQDNQRFEIHGKSSVKYHLKASHVVDAKRWFWTLNNAIQWAKDEAKEEERQKRHEEEMLKHRKAEHAERRLHGEGDASSGFHHVTSASTSHAESRAGGKWHGHASSVSASRITLVAPTTGPASAAGDDDMVWSDLRRPSIGTDLGKVRSHAGGSIADDNTVDDGEFADDASFQSVRPVAGDAFNITAHSIALQLDLLAQVAAAFQREQTTHPELAISDQTVVQAITSYDSAIKALTSLLGDLVKISKDRDAYWQSRLNREANMRRLWEESMTHIAQEQAALESKIGETEDKRRRTKRALREVLRNTEATDSPSDAATAPGEAAAPVPKEAVDESRRDDAGASTDPPDTATSKLKRSRTIGLADLSESEPDDQDEFFDAIDASIIDAAVSVQTATEVMSRPGTAQEQEEDAVKRAKVDEVETSFKGYEDPLRERLKLDADDRPKISLWGVLKSMIGKDMTRMTLPVSFNEPTSLLQRVAEDMEYADTLDVAASRTDSLERMVYVAGFAASEYASTIGRVAKPFNPLLGETFEYARPDKGYRFFVEQVSHHPPIGAIYSESANWDYYGESDVRSKFYGKSFEFSHMGTWFLKLRPVTGGEELYSWKKVNASVVGIITNNPTVDNYGPMQITNWTTGEVCHLDFKQRGWRAAGAYEVKGRVADAEGKTKWSIGGHWNDKLFARYTPGEEVNVGLPGKTPTNLSRSAGQSRAIIIWEANPRPQGIPFNLTPFVMTLNAIPDGLRPYLPPTDTRLRPDQRAMEDGEYDLASTEKHRVEEKQRAKRREMEMKGEKFVPKWFRKASCPVTGEEYWAFDGAYWNMRRKVADGGQWVGPEDIF
ncbi:MAG: hypothetical protein M1815_002598 [Lichina confinis]|nr:MAG: hypothetical protein M1815_002598 [Lichina confinis]